MLARLRARLDAPVDVASLAAFRIFFGAMMFAGVVRFAARGWIAPLYIEPRHYFTYVGFSWVRPLPGPWMYALFAVMGCAALGLTVGWRTRVSALVFAVTFTWVELIDKTNYLNHYYLVSLLAFWLALLPVGGAFSLDARRDPSLARSTVPTWMVWFVRAQLGLVYFCAGVAKLRPDWLLRAEPLHTWLLARADVPVLGALFRYRATAFAFSYGGLVFDLGVAFALCHRRTRPWAYAAVVAFHALTWSLFNIGMFPWVMVVCTTVFFGASWPRILVSKVTAPGRRGLKTHGSQDDVRAADCPMSTHNDQPASRAFPWLPWVFNPRRPGATGALLPLAALHLVVQLALPWRHLLYPGNVLWNEQGFRLAWHVMLIEKSGDVEFHVRDPHTGQRWTVMPEEFLTPLQGRMMAPVPDMIVQAAGWVRDDFARRGHPDVVVTVDAYTSLNGRPARRLIDPAVDLGRERDSLGPKPWITP